ncbi:hypothetical protein A2982_03295 [candidate division WWE3 bacterium RIFCSPLOWO2_01_FULL_39_13]|uniref:Glycosyl transferase family 1 domain-containing protein n=1 Tax=candidate division WWE3 bacterium RIFCSPLOWO2_01_FULL_39_13 TaxID=1802624 RepID=A0A1F4V3B6_UNCKA|nr:MAG: hypothetical protein A2982_03295 [candidate division WWE3 bacterium RIFCSPLOWO2_01_FULL_39_13]
MNILRIVYDWPDENVILEGLAPAPYELSVSQAKLGHKIYVLCGNLNGKNIKHGKFNYSLENGRIEVFNLPRGLSKFGPFLTTSIAVLPFYFYFKFIKKIDLVHNHGHLGVWFLLYKLLFGFLDKTKVIGHYHITAKGREWAIKKQNVKIPFWAEYFEYPIHKLADHLMSKVCFKLVATSRDVIEEVERYYQIDSSKIILLESGVDTARFKKEGQKEDFGFKAGSTIIANGGRLSKRKNIDVLVESLRFLPENYKLVLWGPWEDSLKKKVDEIILKFNLQDRVKYLGVISYFKVDEYFRAADIFVLPSSYEGLPKAVVEALASRCKVLASGFRVDKKISDLYFLDKIDPEYLAERIAYIDRLQLSYKETRGIIEKYYSWDSKAKMLEGIIGS